MTEILNSSKKKIKYRKKLKNQIIGQRRKMKY
jgi:hypothetical protein